MDTNKTLYMKDFLALGYKKTQVSTIERADVFKGLERAAGYAIAYSFNQAVLVCIGCELLNLGVSFRHVNSVLFQLSSKSNYNFEEKKKDYSENKFSLIVSMNNVWKEVSLGNPPIKVSVAVSAKAIVVNGQTIVLTDKLRTQSIVTRFLPEKKLDVLTKDMSGYIRIKVYQILNSLLERT
jgi:hypothetical protein